MRFKTLSTEMEIVIGDIVRGPLGTVIKSESQTENSLNGAAMWYKFYVP